MADRGEELLQVRLDKLHRLRQAGVEPYPPRFRRTHSALKAAALLEKVEAKGWSARSRAVAVAGRIASMRAMGRVAFLDLQDGSGGIQLHLRRDLLGDGYGILKELDLGDILGARGPLFRTRTGEATLEAREVTLLSKALRPPPDKWHGLQDVEQRYRQREVDLLSNQEMRSHFLRRSSIIQAVRDFLVGRGFVEVETPLLVPVAAGAMAQPFITQHRALDRTLYLRIAIELYLKRCIIGGLERVFEIGRVFRNEGLDARHNPEYTLLESYQAYADYLETMELMEQMIPTVAQKVLGTTRVPWGDGTIDFTPPWRRLSLRLALLEHSGVDVEELADAPALAQRMQSMGIQVTQEVSWGRLVDKLLSETVEPRLVQPTFLVDYPVEMSPLAKSKAGDPRYVERFEAFAGGMEIANAFTELNDPVEQRRRLTQQEELQHRYGDEEFDRVDEEFLLALEYGMPPTGGLGVGIDRLVMLLTGHSTIREVLLFPHLSWSQTELFRVLDHAIQKALVTFDSDAQQAFAALKVSLPPEVLNRLQDEELWSRIQAFLQREGHAQP